MTDLKYRGFLASGVNQTSEDTILHAIAQVLLLPSRVYVQLEAEGIRLVCGGRLVFYKY